MMLAHPWLSPVLKAGLKRWWCMEPGYDASTWLSPVLKAGLKRWWCMEPGYDASTSMA